MVLPQIISRLLFFEWSIDNRKPYDIVLVDLTISGDKAGTMVALEMLRLDPHVRIVVASGYSDDPVMANPESYGFEGSLSKPFTYQSVSNFIDNLKMIYKNGKM